MTNPASCHRRRPTEAPAPAEAPVAEDKLHALAERSAATMHSALRDEPDAVIASVLVLADWPWAGALASRLGPARAGAISRLRDEGRALPPAVADALLAALTARADACAADGAGFVAELHAAGRPTAPEADRWWRRRRP